MSDDKQAAVEADTTIADTGALDDLSPSAEDTAYFESEGEIDNHADADAADETRQADDGDAGDDQDGQAETDAAEGEAEGPADSQRQEP